MSNNTITKLDIRTLARFVYGPSATYTEHDGFGELVVDGTTKHMFVVSEYAPKAGRARAGRVLLEKLDKLKAEVPRKEQPRRWRGVGAWMVALSAAISGALKGKPATPPAMVSDHPGLD
jgi:hypothetical protein